MSGHDDVDPALGAGVRQHGHAHARRPSARLRFNRSPGHLARGRPAACAVRPQIDQHLAAFGGKGLAGVGREVE
jgi:hypothetical protein